MALIPKQWQAGHMQSTYRGGRKGVHQEHTWGSFEGAKHRSRVLKVWSIRTTQERSSIQHGN